MNEKMLAIVRKLAEIVSMYAEASERQKVYKKLESALRGVGTVIADMGDNIIFDAEGTEVVLSGDLFIKYADALKVDTTDLLALSVEANNLVKKVKMYVEDELLEGDELDVAVATLTLWDSVRVSVKSPVSGSRRNGVRVSKADVPFPIYASCDVCDKVVVRGGERSYEHDWNSLRHFSQKHAIDAHGTNGFTNLVSDAWREAKEALVSGEVDEFHIPADADMPGFSLIAHK